MSSYYMQENRWDLTRIKDFSGVGHSAGLFCKPLPSLTLGSLNSGYAVRTLAGAHPNFCFAKTSFMLEPLYAIESLKPKIEEVT
jgi:hypothetical protein